jgi:predicted phage-related endonuclease
VAVSLSPEQLALRRTGMGGSETAALFGLDKFKRPFDVYVGKVDGWVPEQTEDMLRGECLEDGIARWYGKKHGVEVINPSEPTAGWLDTLRMPGFTGTFRHATRPLILATPDRLLQTPMGEVELLSIKAPRGADEWGEDETQDYPLRANIQVQQEAAVLASHGFVLARAWVCAPIWGDLRRYPVRLDTELQERIMSGAERWWAKHVATQTPPPIDGGEGARRWLLSRYPTADGKTKLEATLEQEALAAALKEAEAAHAVAEEALETARSRVIASLGSAYGLKGSFGTVTYFENKWNKRSFRARWSNGKAAVNGQ